MNDVLTVGIVFFGIYKIIELFVRQKERRLMIEKMSEVPQEILQSNVQSFSELQKEGIKGNRFSSLRWGAVLVGAGMGWLIGWAFYGVLRNCDSFVFYGNFESMVISTIALCAGLALIIVHLIERNAYKGAKKE